MILLNPNNKSYIEQVAGLHSAFLKTGFLSKLGKNFLINLYEAIARSENSFLIVFVEKEKVIGFISGTENLNLFYKYFFKTYFFNIIVSLLPVIFSFNKLKKVIEIICYIKGKDREDVKLPDAELLSIVVEQNSRGKNIGEKLFITLLEEFKKRNIKEFKIIVGSELKHAKKFYEKLGAEQIGEIELHKGADSIIYIFKVE